ncbi:hypothetical protein Acr_00g0014090 [Actinidia rufa]|uniref:Uncharacterized protein n=1 Tax=Actinidia rufa TaxID=165716 RepID=A0A7J0DA77_9ERIC|nr:hypothetical protein Acr_00g0014090 [Actinidia rufa]
MGLALSTKVKLKRTRPSMKVLSIQQHARNTLSWLEWGRTAGAVLHTTQALAWLHGAEAGLRGGVEAAGCVAAGLRGQEQGLLVGLRGCWTDWAAWLLSGLHMAQGCTGLYLAARCRGRAAGGGCKGVGC